MTPHPECPVGHHPPQHPCDWPDCRCFGPGEVSVTFTTDEAAQLLKAVLADAMPYTKEGIALSRAVQKLDKATRS